VRAKKLLHGHHERVTEPLGEFVEGNDGFPRRAGMRRHDAQRPGIAEADVVYASAGGRPDRSEGVHEGCPQRRKRNDGDRGGNRGGMGKEVV